MAGSEGGRLAQPELARRQKLLDNFSRVQDGIASACLRAGRQREDVSLVAVSKLHPACDIACLSALGQLDFGENYFQEYEQKQAQLQDGRIRWHMIGHLQSRKAAHSGGVFSLIHTIDSRKLALALEKAAPPDGQDVLIEVNLGAEIQKSGIAQGDVCALAEFVLANCPHLKLLGLMCVPPASLSHSPRFWFAALAKIRDQLEREFRQEFPELSMGMSADYGDAILEGATIVRIGTAIFGARPMNGL